MKPIIHKSTMAYLEELSTIEKEEKSSSFFNLYPDVLDQLIAKEKLQIQTLFFDTELDLMLIILNNKKILKESISKYNSLSKASLQQLQTYKISPMGVHWPKLDEDLSLKGFLESALYTSVYQTA